MTYADRALLEALIQTVFVLFNICLEVATSVDQCIEALVSFGAPNKSQRKKLAYLKTQQLNRIYRVFHDADPTDTSVKQVAIANGFSHLGQFSRDYKQLYGELPSETLRRR